MTVTFPIHPPADPGFSRFRLARNSVVSSSASPYTMEDEVQVYDGQGWEAEATIPPMGEADSAAWEAFLGKINGREGSFFLGDPRRRIPRGSLGAGPILLDNDGNYLLDNDGNYLLDNDGYVQVNGAHAARVQDVAVKNCGDASAAAWLKKGDYVQILSGSSARLHQLIADVSTNASAQATLSLWPRTRAALADGNLIQVVDAKGIFRMADNLQALDLDPGPFAHFTFRAREAV